MDSEAFFDNFAQFCNTKNFHYNLHYSVFFLIVRVTMLLKAKGKTWLGPPKTDIVKTVFSLLEKWISSNFFLRIWDRWWNKLSVFPDLDLK